MMISKNIITVIEMALFISIFVWLYICGHTSISSSAMFLVLAGLMLGLVVCSVLDPGDRLHDEGASKFGMVLFGGISSIGLIICALL